MQMRMALIQTVQTRGQITLTPGIRRAAGIHPGDVVLTRVLRPGVVQVTRLPRVDLDDLFERFHFEGPVDEQLDRQAWQGTAAQDALGSAGKA